MVVDEDLDVSGLKSLLLDKTGNKPFFLEYNISNDKKVKDLKLMNKGSYFLIFTNLEVFSLDVATVSGEEGLIIRNLRMTDTLGYLGKTMNHELGTDGKVGDLWIVLENGDEYSLESEDN